MYAVVKQICICVEPNPMTHDTLNLDQYSTYYMFEKLLNGHVFYTNGVVFEHDKVQILKTSK